MLKCNCNRTYRPSPISCTLILFKYVRSETEFEMLEVSFSAVAVLNIPSPALHHQPLHVKVNNPHKKCLSFQLVDFQ